MSLSLLTLLIGPFWIALWVGSVLPDWFRRDYFHFIARFGLGVSLLLALVSLGVGTVVFHKVARLVWFSLWPCMSLGVVILSLCVMSSRSFTLINLKCSAERPGALFDSARFTAQYVRSVGQDVSPGKCVLPSTSLSVRKDMKLWTYLGVAACGKFSWMLRILVVILISLGGLGLEHFPKGLARLFLGSLLWVLYLWGFQGKLWLVRGKYLPAGC